MRLLLRYVTGNPKHPHTDVSDDGVRNVLEGLGWMLTDADYSKTKLAEIIYRLPVTIRDQVAASNPVLTSTRPGTWGIVSHEKRNRLHVRLLHDDLQTLREEAEEVVANFPDAFEAEFDRDLGFEPEVVIRRFDSEERMVAGQVRRLHKYGFWRYLREERRRELLTMITLTLITVAALAGSIPLFFASSATHDYWRGFLDRASTTFLTAVLTILINMILEYRTWSNSRVRIKWAFE
jgi:hypothetical protein